VIAGNEVIDSGTFVYGPPRHIDPALNTALEAYQVINAMYDGLTDVDISDPVNPVIRPHVAESFVANEDASVWTFKIREGMAFSDGEEILPSTFQRSWERASDPDFAAGYSDLMKHILGGAEKLNGAAETLRGVVADDETMTLTVTLAAPFSNFPALAGLPLFYPMPADAMEDPDDYENGLMIGNGPYSLETPRNNFQIVLVKNDTWTGDTNGRTWPTRPDKISFRVSADRGAAAYDALRAGESDTAQIVAAHVAEMREQWGTTLDVGRLGSYHYVFNQRAIDVGGAENRLLRQAVSQAIDRTAINNVLWRGTRRLPSGITPLGIPGFESELCSYCEYDPEAARTALAQWRAAGRYQEGPLHIQFNEDSGHEQVVERIIDDLADVGIVATADPRPNDTYFADMAAGECVLCFAGWYADYPAYDTFMWDLFSSDAPTSNNFGFSNQAFDDLVDRARRTVDPAAQASLFQRAEEVLLNDEIMAVPINWWLGEYVYNDERIERFPLTNMGLVVWEQVELAG
jgi:ABC-type transport system substrate-binding protein